MDPSEFTRHVRRRRKLYHNVTFEDGYGGKYDARRETSYLNEAQLVSSELNDGSKKHRPVLDLDFETVLLPSTAKDHYHLYLNREITWRQYKRLLRAMAGAGLLEKDYVKASIRRGYTSVRVPWLKKELKK